MSFEPEGAALPSHFPVSVPELLGLEELGSDLCIFLSGSSVDGTGNRFSDIDVFVIGDVIPKGEHLHRADPIVWSVHYLREHRVDFEFWPERAVSDLAERLANLSLTYGAGPKRQDAALWKRLSYEDITFIHRVRTGIPLQHPERYAEIRRRFDFHRLSHFLYLWRLREVEAAIEDLYGMMEDPRGDLALLRARDLLDGVVEACAHHLGSTMARRKWRTRILQSLARSEPLAREVLDGYWALQAVDVAQVVEVSSSMRTYAERCIRFANAIVEKMQGIA
ncbi:MAG: nucleotidyltransferase domain-containing protein [Minicystis sp.]